MVDPSQEFDRVDKSKIETLFTTYNQIFIVRNFCL